MDPGGIITPRASSKEKQKSQPSSTSIVRGKKEEPQRLKLGQKCKQSIECVPGAQCLFEVCACPPRTLANEIGHCVSENNLLNNHQQRPIDNGNY